MEHPRPVGIADLAGRCLKLYVRVGVLPRPGESSLDPHRFPQTPKSLAELLFSEARRRFFWFHPHVVAGRFTITRCSLGCHNGRRWQQDFGGPSQFIHRASLKIWTPARIPAAFLVWPKSR